MSIQFMLAARYLSGRKLRTFLTTLAVIFGVMIIFGIERDAARVLAGVARKHAGRGRRGRSVRDQRHRQRLR